ncbi:hypothetical protein [Sphingobium sp. CR28]|uniref:hypothetical protein n=1 Tax=Sphingobium sp. CR28 TaxID=3400272 RepID=UPI003FEE019B
MTLFMRLTRLALTYTISVAVGLLLFVAFQKLPLFSGVTVLFYRGILTGLCAVFVLGLMIAVVAKRFRIDLSTAVGAVIASLSLNICFLVLLPVTVDRSISVFLLARIEQQDGRLTAPALDRLFRDAYLTDLRQIDRRVSEQILSGNISVDATGHIRMTPRGRAFLAFSRYVAAGFDTDRRFVDPSIPASIKSF